MSKRAEMIEALLARVAGDPLATLRLAEQMREDGQEARAVELAASLIAPGAAAIGPEARERALGLVAKQVPDWHFRLVEDSVRNAAYDAALRRAVRPGMRVLDIGAGTGILAMMAARAGAAEVFTCEMNPAVAAAAAEIIARNGYADRVRVIAKHSDGIDVDADLGGRVDLLVSEIVSNDVIGESVLAAHEPAVRNLLEPGAPVIPARAIARVALAEWPGAPVGRMASVDGFDLSPFNRLAPRWHALKRSAKDAAIRSDPADLFDFDLGAGVSTRGRRGSVELVATGGRVDGIAQWLALAMDDVGDYDAGPAATRPCAWAVRFLPLAEPIDTEPGQRLRVAGAHDRLALTIWLE